MINVIVFISMNPKLMGTTMARNELSIGLGQAQLLC